MATSDGEPDEELAAHTACSDIGRAPWSTAAVGVLSEAPFAGAAATVAVPVAPVATVALRSKAVSAPRPSGRVEVASLSARMAPTRSGASRSDAISTVAAGVADAALTRSATVGRVLRLR